MRPLSAFLLISIVSIFRVASAEPAPNAVCDECHAVPGLYYVADSGERRLYSIAPGPYASSVHGGAPCVSCHAPGYGDSLPHTGRSFWPLYSCVDCHEELGDLEHLGLSERKRELLGSVHGKELKPRLDCHDCHDPHTFALVRENEDARDRIDASNALCLVCHGAADERMFGHEALSDAADTHDWFPNSSGHLEQVKCIGCHAPAGPGQGHDVLPTADSVKDCVVCHTQGEPRYAASYAEPGGPPDPAASRAEAFDNVYVIGSTRSVWLDRLSQVGFTFFLLGVLVHSVRRRRMGAKRTRWLHVEGSRSLRGWHLLQVVLIAGLLLSGLSMHYADSGFAPVPFRLAVRAHNVLGVANVVLWLGFLVMNARSGNARFYVARLRELPRELPRQLRYYAVGTFRGESEPFPPGSPTKFNPLQRLAYLSVMYGLTPLAVVSGLILLFPVIAPEQVLGHPGLWPTALVHLSAAYLLTLFVVVHVYMISAAPEE